MDIQIFQVDAFTDVLFGGNPAAVCPLAGWLPDATLQAIAAENNLSETAFLVREGEHYLLRWFTPAVEVDLCGHATLASAFVVFTFLEPQRARVDSRTVKAGVLRVSRNGGGSDAVMTMDFPARPASPIAVDPALVAALGGPAPREVLKGARDFLVVYDKAEAVKALQPDFGALAKYSWVIVTAPADASDHADFVSRFFAPGSGIPEDPVTGSAHCTLVPYWAAKLGKAKLEAYQVSRRGGRLSCTLEGERVAMAGRAVLYMSGSIYV